MLVPNRPGMRPVAPRRGPSFADRIKAVAGGLALGLVMVGVFVGMAMMAVFGPSGPPDNGGPDMGGDGAGDWG